MSFDLAKRPRASEGVSETMQHMHALRSLVEHTSDTLRESFTILDTCAKRKAALVTSLAHTTDDDAKAQYTRLISESDAALEIRQCVIRELRKMYDFTRDVTAAPVGEFPAYLEEPPKSLAKGASSYIALHRVRKFYSANVPAKRGVPVEDTVVGGSVTIGDSTLRLAPYEICHLYQTIVGPAHVMRQHPGGTRNGNLFRILLRHTRKQLEKKVLRESTEILNHLNARLLSIMLPNQENEFDLTDDVYVTNVKATCVNVDKTLDALHGYFNSFREENTRTTYIECRKKNSACDIETIKTGGSITKSSKYKHVVTSSEYFIDISDIEDDPEVVVDVMRSCRSLVGHDNMLIRVQRCPGSVLRGTYLCLHFKGHQDVLTETDVDRKRLLFKKYEEQAFAVYLTLKNYCLVSSGMRVAVEHALVHNTVDVSRDMYFHNFMPCGIQHGVENLTNAAIMYVFTHYQAQLTIVPLPPRPPSVLPTFDTLPLPQALQCALEEKEKLKATKPTKATKRKPAQTPATQMLAFKTPQQELLVERASERAYTVQMHEHVRALLQTPSPDIMHKLTSVCQFPTDSNGLPELFNYDEADEIGLAIYDVLFPPRQYTVAMHTKVLAAVHGHRAPYDCHKHVMDAKIAQCKFPVDRGTPVVFGYDDVSDEVGLRVHDILFPRRFTVAMYNTLASHLQSATIDQDVYDRAMAVYTFPVDKDGDVILFQYNDVSDDDGLKVYDIFFPVQMEHDSDDEWDLEQDNE